jgi:TonB family protein
MIRPATRLSLTLLLTCFCLFLVPRVNAQDAAQNERRLIGYTSEFWGRSWATKQVLPAYPAEAIAQNIQGVIETAVGINDDGRVIKVRVPPGLDPRLRKAAIAAVKQWKFRPRANKMQPGEFGTFRLTLSFHHRRGRGARRTLQPAARQPRARSHAWRFPAQPHGVA